MSLFEYRPPQATIRHRLRYNILPTDEERKSIVDSLSIARDRLFAIRATGLSTSARYRSQDKALSVYISEYSSLVAPIRRLNDDVLALVFVTVHSEGLVDFRRRTFGHPMPLEAQSFASNSYHWRCVAMQTPEIWSTLSHKCWRGKRGLEYLRECLRNSKNHGLSLHLDLSLPPTSMKIINELIVHAERWVALRLTIQDTETLHLLDPVRGRLSRLRQVAFTFDVTSSPPAVTFDAFMIAPRLCTVQLLVHGTMHCIPPLPFHQITEVSFVDSSRIAVQDSLPLFRGASRIDISLDTGSRVQGEYPSASRRNVEVIEVHICDDGLKANRSIRMLETLTAPNLAKLHLDCLAWEGPSILRFITRSACPLRELVLQDTSVRVGELLALLLLTPTLNTLVLAQLLPNSITDALMSPLTPAPNNANLLLPMLEQVVIAGTYLFSTNVLLNMLERRSPTLVNVDIALADRQIGTVDRARFAALRTPSTKISRLMCLDEMRSLVWVN